MHESLHENIPSVPAEKTRRFTSRAIKVLSAKAKVAIAAVCCAVISGGFFQWISLLVFMAAFCVFVWTFAFFVVARLRMNLTLIRQVKATKSEP